MKLLELYKKVMTEGQGKGAVNTIRKKIKYVTRNLLYFPYAKRWGESLVAHPHLQKEVFRYPVLCSKLHRPYMTNFLKAKDKVEILEDSYQALDALLGAKDLDKIYQEGKLLLLRFAGKTGIELEVYLRLYTNFEKEGEYNLLLCHKGDILSCLTFSLWKGRVFIGGLQGLERGNHNTDLLKDVTKDCYGLFPKRIIMEVCNILFPGEKLAVGNASHIYLAARYKFKEKRKISADYDSFWESIGGEQEKNGLWKLPKSIARKDIEEIASKKRSQYRRRYELLDSLEKGLTDFLQHSKENGGSKDA